MELIRSCVHLLGRVQRVTVTVRASILRAWAEVNCCVLELAHKERVDPVKLVRLVQNRIPSSTSCVIL